MTEIALAYSSIDKARAEAITRVLGALGYAVSPQPLTANAVDEAKALVVFWSSGSVNSIPINQFAAQASANRKLVSVRAGQADPPAAYALVALHDLSRWTGSLEAPELRTFLQHVVRMAPPKNATAAATLSPQQMQPRAPVNVAASNATPFNFAGPPLATPRAPEPALVRTTPPPQNVQQHRHVGLRAAPPQPVAPQLAPQQPAPQQTQMAPHLAPQPAPLARSAAEKAGAAMPRQLERPEPRRASERRRAGGGGVARVAFGAIAVSVVAGAAVAAFNYEPGQQNASASPEPVTTNVAINVAPNAMPGPVAGTVTDAAPETASLTSVQVASAEPLPAPLATPDTAAIVQSARGWTASLPTLPATPKATPASATSVGAPATTRPPSRQQKAMVRLTPIDAPLSSTGIVAIDNANLGSGAPVNTLASDPNRARTPEEERAWIRKQATYGPE